MRASAIFATALSSALLTSRWFAGANANSSLSYNDHTESDHLRLNRPRQHTPETTSDDHQDSKANSPFPHSHNHRSEPLLQLNETLILMEHKPTPPSYGTHDFEDPGVEKKYPGLMALHALFMSMAFFIALPAGIALRSASHAWHGFSVVLFYGLVVLGISTSALYAKLTPNMYEGSTHTSHGYFILFLALTLTTLDAFAMAARAVRFIRTVRAGKQAFGIGLLWHSVVLSHEGEDTKVLKYDHAYTSLVGEEPAGFDVQEQEAADAENYHAHKQGGETPYEETAQWVNAVHDHHKRQQRGYAWRRSVASDAPVIGPRLRSSHYSNEALRNINQHSSCARISLLRRIGRVTFNTLERALVFFGYAQVLSGIVVYTGACRDSYIIVCLAHLIKGGIFWCYGLVTFARYLGVFADRGWAWNRPPRGTMGMSAEFVESLIIFIYGITNTWMERFGDAPGTPLSTKEVQHISIDVMFWFAGLIGMGIESKRVRRWLASTSTTAHSPSPLYSQQPVLEPESYTASFNPFPALVIGITGAAMAAHAQVYLFQVQIHMLWGFLLVGFAVFRSLTYFFLWLGPPRSILPSRPPTEALGSFFVACGGLVIQFSTDELTIAAMRRGRDDQMMFLNVAVSITCFAFCWILGVSSFNGWLNLRTRPAITLLSDA